MRVALHSSLQVPLSLSPFAVSGIAPVALWDFAEGIFPTGFSHSRASGGTAFSATGQFETIGAGMMRFDRSTSKPEVILENASTNLLANSAAAVEAGWTPSGASAVTLALSTLGVFSGCRTVSNGATWHRLLHAVRPILAAGTAYRVTAWVTLGTSGQAVVILRDNAGATETRVQFTATTTSVQSEAAGPVTDLRLKQRGSALELSFVLTPNFSRDLNFGIGPASAVAGEDVIVLGAQLTQSSEISTYIPTIGGAVMRSADIVNWDAPSGTFDLRIMRADGTHIDQTGVAVAAGWSPGLPISATSVALYPSGTL